MSTTTSRCLCGTRLDTPCELTSGRCIPCALFGPPSATILPHVTHETALAIVLKHWRIGVESRGHAV